MVPLWTITSGGLWRGRQLLVMIALQVRRVLPRLPLLLCFFNLAYPALGLKWFKRSPVYVLVLWLAFDVVSGKVTWRRQIPTELLTPTSAARYRYSLDELASKLDAVIVLYVFLRRFVLRYFLNGVEGKGEGKKYKWWCKRCFVEYYIDLPEGH
ncbi:hypothetical protein AK812_SmicGene31925 [Symbiodinium microadriaticum]|uniref:Uncharacterized protein n=1 Tax=Symbiodinium microadriaticum TaxID=2951 RepID=A0A1Q9CVH3_SYMMI|nr:hypothetical protein AK812_SmicGene31925 [Symbiodinium microadriaticum]